MAAKVSATLRPVLASRSTTRLPWIDTASTTVPAVRSIMAAISLPFSSREPVRRDEALSTVSTRRSRVTLRSVAMFSCTPMIEVRMRSELLTMASRWLTNSSMRPRIFSSFSP